MAKIKMVILSFFLIILIVVFCSYSMIIKSSDISSDLHIRNDIEPIKKHLNMLDGIEKVYWISGNDNVISLGPTDIYIKGFIILSKKKFDNIIFSYDWTEINISFDKNFQPSLTGFSNFNWCYSEKFSSDLRGISFMGNAYVDRINSIIYFDFNTF